MENSPSLVVSIMRYDVNHEKKVLLKWFFAKHVWFPANISIHRNFSFEPLTIREDFLRKISQNAIPFIIINRVSLTRTNRVEHLSILFARRNAPTPSASNVKCKINILNYTVD